MVEIMIEKAEMRAVRFVSAFPTELDDAEGTSRGDPVVKERNVQIAIEFWRSVGFQRFGTTDWFCYALVSPRSSCFLKEILWFKLNW